MKKKQPPVIFLKDYRPSAYQITHIDLTFHLDPERTKVAAKMRIIVNPKNGDGELATEPLILDGEKLELASVRLNGKELVAGTDFHQDPTHLSLLPLATAVAELEVITWINPLANTALNGLYYTEKMFCTQNEPQGFRKITYYLDRPDNLATFTTTIIAERALYPILLSNGNLLAPEADAEAAAAGNLPAGWHCARWADPFPKPSYLYALVAGDLGMIADEFITSSGRVIDLRIYCNHGNESKCQHAMLSLKKAMKWDEDCFGLEYDLDIFMIVAVQSFNSGAMENKGLNIFNAKLVLADAQTATDDDFLRIESVIGHEYFHNWTGNRVTCRDWFQLTLKEGLTVYRDQEFSAHMMQDAVLKRIEDVERLRISQFSEDHGPTAHPIKPQSYIEINNFYTPTVYEKGAEVIRMLATILGPEGFRRGIDQYFAWFDGQAVTTEDFLQAMSVANGNYDLGPFQVWYHQAGTPSVQVVEQYDAVTKTLQLEITQQCQQTGAAAKQSCQQPFVFPFNVGILNSTGQDLVDTQLMLKQERETFTFDAIPADYVLSLNRNFSAPVQVVSAHSLAQRADLFAHDTDQFNRYDAGQELAKQVIRQLLAQYQQAGGQLQGMQIPREYILGYQTAMAAVIPDGMKAHCLRLPGLNVLKLDYRPLDVAALHKVRDQVQRQLLTHTQAQLEQIYQQRASGQLCTNYSLSGEAIGRRRLKNFALNSLVLLDADTYGPWAYRQWQQADNMTDILAALQALAQIDSSYAEEALTVFYQKWQHDPLVLGKWYTVVASSRREGTGAVVSKIWQSNEFDLRVPNLVRALLGAFACNYPHFHDATGSGYDLLATGILRLDPINPQIAASLLKLFNDYQFLVPTQQRLMRNALEQIISASGLSKNVTEIAHLIFDSDCKDCK